MTARARSSPRRPGVAGALLGLLALAVMGFGLGFLAGGLLEAPDLVARHLVGSGEAVEWGPETRVAGEAEAVPAGPPDAGRAAADSARRAPHVSAAPPFEGPGAARIAVQVGAFAESRSAEELAERLRAEGFPAYLSAGAGAAGARWRVRVGPFPSREVAQQQAARLKVEQKLPTWVLDEDGPTG